MKIWIGDKFIDSSYFRTWCLNEDFNLVYFIYQPRSGYQGEFSIPMLFSNAEQAKRFYDETWNAIADGSEAVWCVDESVKFCWKLYFKIHAQKLKERKMKKTKKKEPHEDNNTPGNTPDGTVQGDSVPREGLLHKLLLRLSLRRGRRAGDGVPGTGSDDVQ